jgi:hypothetical protein
MVSSQRRLVRLHFGVALQQFSAVAMQDGHNYLNRLFTCRNNSKELDHREIRNLLKRQQRKGNMSAV